MTVDVQRIRLNFTGESNNIEDIKKCLQTLYSTPAGKQPLDREFGLKWDFVGKPIEVAENELKLEIIEKTERYEQRVEVDDITCEYQELDGILIPTILLKINDDSEEDDED